MCVFVYVYSNVCVCAYIVDQCSYIVDQCIYSGSVPGSQQATQKYFLIPLCIVLAPALGAGDKDE